MLHTQLAAPALQVCRCVPFIHRAMRLEELVSVREIRAIIKEQFLRYKDVKDPRVSNVSAGLSIPPSAAARAAAHLANCLFEGAET